MTLTEPCAYCNRIDCICTMPPCPKCHGPMRSDDIDVCQNCEPAG